MSDFDPSKLTGDNRRKIARRASRKVGSEVTLILTAGFAICMVVLFWFGQATFLPLAEALDARPTVAWFFLGVAISIVFALVYGIWVSRKVARAREQQFLVQSFDGKAKRAEVEQKVQKMKDSNLN